MTISAAENVQLCKLPGEKSKCFRAVYQKFKNKTKNLQTFSWNHKHAKNKKNKGHYCEISGNWSNSQPHKKLTRLKKLTNYDRNEVKPGIKKVKGVSS